jgi:hypothetical protein
MGAKNIIELQKPWSSEYSQADSTVTDKGNGRQPACPGEWKMCKEEHE